MLNFGIIGLNEGNGHPYSYSAVFNDFDEEALARECPFELIREYLVTHHRHRSFIDRARISHIWTQDRASSERVARVAKIPHIADSIEELAAAVDGIIFARDDVWNHWEMAGRLFRTGKPIYMDKLLAHSEEDLARFIAAAGPDYPLLTASSFRFAPTVEAAARELDPARVMTVHGVSPCIWVRYAPHLLDPLFRLFGRDIVTVQNCGRDRADTVCLTYRNGLQAVLQVFDGVSLPIALTCHSAAGAPPRRIDYTDPGLESYFFSIVRMMTAFTELAEGDRPAVPFADAVFLNRVVLAAIESREQGGRLIEMEPDGR